MEKDRKEFYQYLDEISSESGFEFHVVQKAFAYQAAKNYHNKLTKQLKNKI